MWPAPESWRSVALGARPCGGNFLRMFVRPNLIAPRLGDGRTGGTLTILRRGAPTKFASHGEHRRSKMDPSPRRTGARFLIRRSTLTINWRLTQRPANIPKIHPHAM